MKTKYLKVYYDAEPETIMAMLRINEGKTISVYNNRISVFDLSEEDFQGEEYKEATAKEFDQFLEQTFKNIDQYLNPVLS